MCRGRVAVSKDSKDHGLMQEMKLFYEAATLSFFCLLLCGYSRRCRMAKSKRDRWYVLKAATRYAC